MEKTKAKHISRTIKVGRVMTPLGLAPCTVNIGLEYKVAAGTEQTVGLDHIPAGAIYAVLSISGDTPGSSGQCQDTLARLLHDGKLVEPHLLLQAILNLWEDWHLNDLSAGCQHQREAGWRSCPSHYDEKGKEACNEASVPSEGRTYANSGYGFRPYRCTADKIGVECPKCGYSYGSKWLVRPLPKVVEDQVTALIQGAA